MISMISIYKDYFKKYKFLFIMAVSCVIFEAICDLLQPTIMARIIDEGSLLNIWSGRLCNSKKPGGNLGKRGCYFYAQAGQDSTSSH